jgi:hypothetical protein
MQTMNETSATVRRDCSLCSSAQMNRRNSIKKLVVEAQYVLAMRMVRTQALCVFDDRSYGRHL